MNIVLFSDEEILEPLSLFDERAQHILKVLKKQEVIISKQALYTEWLVRLIFNASMRGIHFHFTPSSNGKPLYPVSVIIGFPRPIQLKRAFRDMAGLGVSDIFLVGTELGEKSYLSSRIVKEGAAYEALKDGCAQAKSTHIPNLSVHDDSKSCLDYLANQNKHYQNPSSIKIILDPNKGKGSLQSLFAQNYGAVDAVLDYYYMGQTDTAPHIFFDWK